MNPKKFIKIRPDQVELDDRFQRALDENRVAHMIDSLDPNRIGVPVVSARGALGKERFVAIDGQHRVSALTGAGRGAEPILMEAYYGLSLEDEARLFLELNGGRKAVNVLDKFKARLVAQEPIALEIRDILSAFKLRIGRGQGARTLNAVDAVEYVHRRKQNLQQTMAVVAKWSDGDPGAFNGQLIRAVSEFLSRFPDAKVMILAKHLDEWAPDRVISKIKRLTSNATPKADAFCDVFFEIYNYRLKRPDKLQMPTKLKAVSG